MCPVRYTYTRVLCVIVAGWRDRGAGGGGGGGDVMR